MIRMFHLMLSHVSTIRLSCCKSSQTDHDMSGSSQYVSVSFVRVDIELTSCGEYAFCSVRDVFAQGCSRSERAVFCVYVNNVNAASGQTGFHRHCRTPEWLRRRVAFGSPCMLNLTRERRYGRHCLREQSVFQARQCIFMILLIHRPPLPLVMLI